MLFLKNQPSVGISNGLWLHEAWTFRQLQQRLDYFLDSLDFGSLTNIGANTLLLTHAHKEKIHFKGGLKEGKGGKTVKKKYLKIDVNKI